MEFLLSGAILFGVIFYLCKVEMDSKKPNVPTYDGSIKCCPRCGSTNHNAFVNTEVVIPGKVKNTTSLNLNPLKPFTITNHKQKIIRHDVTREVTKFVCNDCGNIYQ